MAERRISSSRGRAALLAAALAVMTPASSQAAPALEFAVKATFLYKFFAFVDWPAGALGASGEPVALCIVGDDPFGSIIEQAGADQRVGDHPIEVRRLRQAVRGSGCRVIYIRAGADQSVSQALEAVTGEPVLTVTDGAGGGAIRFVVQGGKVRFSVDQPVAAGNGLALSSKLLSVAVKVRR